MVKRSEHSVTSMLYYLYRLQNAICFWSKSFVAWGLLSSILFHGFANVWWCGAVLHCFFFSKEVGHGKRLLHQVLIKIYFLYLLNDRLTRNGILTLFCFCSSIVTFHFQCVGTPTCEISRLQSAIRSSECSICTYKAWKCLNDSLAFHSFCFHFVSVLTWLWLPDITFVF